MASLRPERSTVHNESDAKSIQTTLRRHGYTCASKIADTLQGSIWSSTRSKSDEAVVVKVSRRTLVRRALGVSDGTLLAVQENVFKERAILKYLTRTDSAPKGIVRYMGWFHDERNYYLVEEHGGRCLFDVVTSVHDHIKEGRLSIAEWHKAVRVLFRQMVHTTEYIHARNVAVYDISIENMLLNDCEIDVFEDGRFSFVLEQFSLKFCDFGLAEHFEPSDDANDEKSKSDSGEAEHEVSFVWSKNVGKSNYKCPEMHEMRAGKRKTVDARANDVHCLGVSLFMLLIGGMPFKRATPSDPYWRRITKSRREMEAVLREWGRDHYVTRELTALMTSMLKREAGRISLSELKEHPWLHRAL